MCDLTQVQRSLDSAASTINNYLREPGRTDAGYFLSASSGEVSSAVPVLKSLGHTDLAAKLLDDSNALDGAFVSKVGPGPVLEDLAGIRSRIREGVALLDLDITDVAKVADFR